MQLTSSQWTLHIELSICDDTLSPVTNGWLSYNVALDVTSSVIRRIALFPDGQNNFTAASRGRDPLKALGSAVTLCPDGGKGNDAGRQDSECLRANFYLRLL